MSLVSGLLAIVTDPTYGIPLIGAMALTVAVSYWSWRRTARLPDFGRQGAPETWRLQLDALVYANLSQGRYSAAIDGLGRVLSVEVRERFRVQLGDPNGLDDPEANRLLAPPTTLRSLVNDLNRAYTSAAWAEQPGWLADRWGWLKRRQRRRAARDFAVVTYRVISALAAFEAG
jgi:hypothetical protein